MLQSYILFIIAFITVLVVCDLFAVIATFSPSKLFINVDFPTFVLPIIETNPDLNFSIFTSLIYLFLRNYFIMFFERKKD